MDKDVVRMSEEIGFRLMKFLDEVAQEMGDVPVTSVVTAVESLLFNCYRRLDMDIENVRSRMKLFEKVYRETNPED